MRYPTTTCDVPEHGPCEGHSFHIKARCDNGCPQFRDGSWFKKNFCREDHPGGPANDRLGEAEVVRAYIEAHLP